MTVVNYKIQLKPIFQFDFQQDEVSDYKFELKKLINRRVENQISRMDYDSFIQLVNTSIDELVTCLMMGMGDIEVVNSLLASESNGSALWIEGMIAFKVDGDSLVEVNENSTQLLLDSWFQFNFSNWVLSSSYIQEIGEWNYNIDWSLQLGVVVEYSDVKWTHEN